MKKTLAFAVLLFFTATVSASTLSVDEEITGEETDLRFYPGEEKVSIVTVMSGDTEIRENQSYSEWAEIEAHELAAEKIEEELEERLTSLDGIGVSWSTEGGDHVSVTYHLDGEGEPRANISYQQLKNSTPEKVYSTVTFPGNETFPHQVPVRIDRQEAADLLDAGAYADSNVSTHWNSALATLETTAAMNASSNMTGVRYSSGERYNASFSGYVRMPSPCHTLEHQIVRDGGSYHFNVWATETNSSCEKQTSAAKYTAAFQSDEPFKLDVSYGEFERTLEHPGDPGNKTSKGEDRSKDTGGLLGLLLGLLPF